MKRNRLHLDERGFGWHILLPIIVVIAVGAIGLHLLFDSRADTPPTNGLLLTGSGVLATANDSAEDQILPEGQLYSSTPSWSPDGNQIAYLSKAGSNLDVDVTTPSSTTPQTIYSTPLLSLYQGPIWSPDGNWLAFTDTSTNYSTSTESAGIYIIHPDGSGLQKLTLPSGDSVGTFSWDSASQDLDVFSESTMCTVPIDGSAVTCASNSIPANAQGITLSPNGSQVAYAYGTTTSNTTTYNIYVANVDGSDAKQISQVTAGQDSAESPVWSPDGTKLAYDIFGLGQYGNLTGVYTNTLAGTAQTKVGTLASFQVAWQPVTSATTFKLAVAATCSITGIPATTTVGETVTPTVTIDDTGTVPLYLVDYNTNFSIAPTVLGGNFNGTVLPGKTYTLKPGISQEIADNSPASGIPYYFIGGIDGLMTQKFTCTGHIPVPAVSVAACYVSNIPGTASKNSGFGPQVDVVNNGNTTYTPTLKTQITFNTGSPYNFSTYTLAKVAAGKQELKGLPTYIVSKTTKATSATLKATITGATKSATCSQTFKIS